MIQQYNFKHEVGAIISVHGDILRLIHGTPGSVEFPSDLIWDLHQKSPGIIHTIAHTHPDGIVGLSNTDMKLFQGWAWAFYPFPIRMRLLVNEHGIMKNIEYLGQLELKSEWINRGKSGKRQFSIITTEIEYFHNYSHPKWEDILVEESYG